MSPNTWIILGVIALAFSSFAIPYGFYLRGESTKASAIKPSVSVISLGQKNSITANTVSIENMTVIQGNTPSATQGRHETKQPQSFILADCAFDGVFEISASGLQAFRRSFPGETGTLTIILQMHEKNAPDQTARLQLAGDWQGTTGMVSRYPENSVIFTLSERRFTLLHKKPIIEFVSSAMQKIEIGRQYTVELSGFPGFAVPLIPRQLTVRTHEGVLHSIKGFSGPDRGWYVATFSP